MVDWVQSLNGYAQTRIEESCSHYLRSQPNKRPVPADIIRRIKSQNTSAPKADKAALGDRSTLDEREIDLLENKVLPTARRWLTEYADNESMVGAARKTLAYWGEMVDGC